MRAATILILNFCMCDRTCETVFVLTYALIALLFFSSNLVLTLATTPLQLQRLQKPLVLVSSPVTL